MAPHYELARRKYRECAPYYDRIAAPALGSAYQREAIRLLHLERGDAVIDVGCGTGANFPGIERAIGPAGRLIGIDVSEAMLDEARARVASGGWENVRLLCAPAEEARIAGRADAALFSFAHDVLQSRAALDNVFRHLKPGARVAACGIQWADWWNAPLNLFIWQLAALYHADPRGLARPWAVLADYLPDLEVASRGFGAIYLASGTAGPPGGRRRARR